MARLSVSGTRYLKPEDAEEAKPKGGLKALFRRASISMKGRERRHSHAVEERPPTAWRRLKSAASFQRHSRFLPSDYNLETPIDSYEKFTSPVPGNANAPPIIPLGSGGAARATAAAQNEYYGRRSRQFEHLVSDEPFGDRESGIGISVTLSAEPVTCIQESGISRIDFIHDLPAELAIHILSHLDLSTLHQAMLVSRRWVQVISSPQIWREVFIREMTKTYAMSKPPALGTGLGLPNFKPETDWKELYRIKQRLERNWREGEAKPCYLNGHLDSIYCVQFDE